MSAADPNTLSSSRPAPPRRRLRAWGVVLVATAMVTWSFCVRTPCGPAAGEDLNGEISRSRMTTNATVARTKPKSVGYYSPIVATPLRQATRLRIGNFNIHGGKGLDGVRDLERTAECLAGLDLAGINEVHGAFLWDTRDQAEVLGRLLGRTWLFAPTEERWWHYLFGNGVLTRLDVDFWQRIPLPKLHGRSFRNMLLVAARVDGRRVNVLITHLDRSDDRERVEQLRTVGEFFQTIETPAVLMGDLNTGADDPTLARLLADPEIDDPVGEVMGSAVPPRIDWILSRGLRTIDAGLVETATSDHPYVWAEFELLD